MIAILLAILAAAEAGALPEATPLGLDVQVAPEQVSLGEHVLVRIAVDHESRDVYSLTGFDPSPLAVPQGTPPMKVHREELPEGHARTVFELTLADYGTVEPRVPDLTLHVTGAEGERVLNIRGRPLKFRSLVQEEGGKPADQAHHGPKPPVPVMVRSYLWVWLLLGVLAVAAAIVALRRRKARPPAVAVAPKIEAEIDNVIEGPVERACSAYVARRYAAKVHLGYLVQIQGLSRTRVICHHQAKRFALGSVGNQEAHPEEAKQAGVRVSQDQGAPHLTISPPRHEAGYGAEEGWRHVRVVFEQGGDVEVP